MSADRVYALISYYAREGYARNLQNVCNEVLKKRANDPVLVFWRAYGLLLEGASSEALRELQSVSTVPELELASAAAMRAAHEAAKVVDNDAIMELETKLDVEESSATDAAALHLGSFYLLGRQKERARSLLERCVRMGGESGAHARTQLGWVIVQQHREPDLEMAMALDEGELDEALEYFETALGQNSSDLEAMMGRAKVLELKHQLGPSLDQLTEMSVKFSWFMPALLEKTRLLLAVGDIEQHLEHVAAVLKADAQNPSALAWTALNSMVREGNNKATAKTLQELFTAINRHEPKNADLYYRLARPFARLAGSDPQILTVTGMMSERAVQLKPDHAPYIVEAGYNRLFLEEYAAANEKFSAALQIDELNLEASAGALECMIMAGELEEAASQVMFLQEMYTSQSTMGMGGKKVTRDDLLMGENEPPMLSYLKGMLSWKSGDTDGLADLERSIGGHFAMAEEVLPGLDTFVTLCPVRITSIVRMLLSTVGGDPRAPTEAPSPLIAKCMRVLEVMSKQCPALLEVQLLQTRAMYLNGQLDQALRKCSEVLRSNPEEHNTHLLICSIYVHQDKAPLAMSALDQAVSANFAVRETPLYAVVNAKVLIASGRLEEARKVLETAMNLPGVRTKMDPKARARMTRRFAEPSLHERASIYLLLADVLGRMSKLPEAPEAKKVIQDAIREFEGTSEEVRVTVADSELAIARGDVEGALKKLRKIPAQSPHYTKARMAMADIYLRHRKDKASYVRCYLDLVDVTPDYDTCCMLGEAFMQIQEPEKAVRAFESALEYQPKDVELVTKIARALVTSHDYLRAIDYYNKAISLARGNWALQLELSTLLVRLQQWPAATTVLNKCLERQREGAPQSVDNLTTDVEAWLTMARVYKGQMDMDSYVEACAKALELQKGLLSKLRGEIPETMQAQRLKTAGICYDLAEHHKRARKLDKAMEYYNEALRHCDTHAKSMLALAKLLLAAGNTDACQQQCVTLLKHDPDNEEASIMLAELMFHKEHYDSAIYHFQQLLERSPNHYGALAQIIQLLWRAGRLDDVPRYFTLAEQGSPKAVMDPGYHFCKGVYARYTNDPREALREFNLARKDSKWGTQALLHMVEVYLSPDNDAAWEENEKIETPESREATATARSLLAQVRPQDQQSQRFRVLECYAMMAGRGPAQVEAALGKLLDLANADPNNVPVLLAMATGFMMLKQTPKARNQLKRVQKIPYKTDESEEFERAWLLLADIHIQGGKFDLAQDLCQKCLKYNKSCAKAWEYMGAVMEREQSYKDAAEHYEKAWKHENQASAQVGYKLAFNYLKAKRFVEAIEVCHKVIKAFPDYPRIRKDVLEKARMGLRP